MKLNSKSGATLAAAAAPCSWPVRLHRPARLRRMPRWASAWRPRLQGPARLQGRRKLLQGPEFLQDHGFLDDLREAVHGDRWQVREGLIVPTETKGVRHCCRALLT